MSETSRTPATPRLLPRRPRPWTLGAVVATGLCLPVAWGGCSSDAGKDTGSSSTGGAGGEGGVMGTGGAAGGGGGAGAGAGGTGGSSAFGGDGGGGGSGAATATASSGTRGSGGSGGSGTTEGAGGSGASDSSTGGTESIGAGGMGESGGGEGGDGGEVAAGPRLTGLVVTGTEVPLTPTFDPDRERYSVLESDPEGDLTLTATAPPGVGIEVDGVEVESGEPLELPDTKPKDEIRVTVSDSSGDSRTYTVLYLPYNFARFRVTVRKPSASTDPIYVAPAETGSSYIVKVDNFGVPLYYKETIGQDFKKHPTGQLSYTYVNASGVDCIVLDQNFQQVDKVNALEIPRTDEHEFLILPNGNYMVLGEEIIPHDLSEYGGAADGTAHDYEIQEISPDKQLLFSWNTWGQLAYDENVSNISTEQPDYAHLNSIALDPDGDLLVSSRHQAQVFKIDRDTGDIVWRLGGISGDFEFVNDPYGGLCGQHSASYLPNGHILLFDNGIPCYPDMPERNRATRVVEYELDETAMTAELVWSYTSSAIETSAKGSAQRLPNGNTFIGWGNNGDNPILVTEIDPDGDIVFEMEARIMEGAPAHSYRAFRFAD